MRKRLYTEREKWCPGCKAWLGLEDFGVSSYHPSGRRSRCRGCSRRQGAAYTRRYRQGLPDSGLLALWEAQGRQCAVCHGPIPQGDRRASHVDRDPATREVRGLLCSRCRAGVGCFQGNQIVIRELLRYLQAFERRRRAATTL